MSFLCFCCPSDTGPSAEVVFSPTDERGPHVDAMVLESGPTVSRGLEVEKPSTSTADRPTSLSASSVSASNRAQRPACEEFELRLDKGSSSMGIDISAAKDGKVMLISKVNKGAIQDWNVAAELSGHAHAPIRRGDRVVEVDGSGRGSAGNILQALRGSSSSVALRILRIHEFKVTNLSNVPRDALGLEFVCESPEDGGSAAELILAGVGPKANKTLQADVELRAGDCVLEVNGTVGGRAELEASINASDSLTLRVRRAA